MTADGWAYRAQLVPQAAVSALLSAVVRESCPPARKREISRENAAKKLAVLASKLAGSGHCCDETQRRGTGSVGHKYAADMNWQEKAFIPVLTLLLGWTLSLGRLHS